LPLTEFYRLFPVCAWNDAGQVLPVNDAEVIYVHMSVHSI